MKPNDIYKNIHTGENYVILAIDKHGVIYAHLNYPNNKQYWSTLTFLDYFRLQSQHWTNIQVKPKPLDQAMQKLDKVYCTHKNVSKEQYFTAMVFITCKDCGKPLN